MYRKSLGIKESAKNEWVNASYESHITCIVDNCNKKGKADVFASVERINQVLGCSVWEPEDVQRVCWALFELIQGSVLVQAAGVKKEAGTSLIIKQTHRLMSKPGHTRYTTHQVNSGD